MTPRERWRAVLLGQTPDRAFHHDDGTNLRIFEACGYVVAPCHNVQPITPTANILALYETVAEHGGRG